jgi:hypothetical protein
MLKRIKRLHCPTQHVPRILLAVPTKIADQPGRARELHEFELDGVARTIVAGNASRGPEYADALLDRKFTLELRAQHFNRRGEQIYGGLRAHSGLVEVIGTWNAKQRSLRALFCYLLSGPALANGLLLLATQPRGNGGFSVNYLLVAQASPCWALPTLPPVLKRANGLFDFGCELIFGEIVFEN